MRVPIILQHDATDCGPAALAMVAAYHGKRVSVARLREVAGTDWRGTALSGLVTAAVKIGFSARAVRATAAALDDIQLPAIAHCRENDRNHFVVICRLTLKHAIIADPARGHRTLPLQEFYKHWSGVLLLLQATPRLQNAITRKSSFVWLCSLLVPHRRLVLDSLLAAVFMTILGLTSSLFIQALVDFVLVFGQKPSLNTLGLGMLAVLLSRTAFLGLRSYLLAHVSQRIDADVVLGYFHHLLGLPLSFFVSNQPNKMTHAAVSATTLSLALDSALAFIPAALMLAIDWRVTWIPIAIIPCFAALVWFLSTTASRRQHRIHQNTIEIDSQVAEALTSIQTVKALRAEPSIGIRMEMQFRKMLEGTLKREMIGSYAAMVSAFGAGLSSLLLLWLGGRAVMAGSMTVGQLMATNTLLGMLLGPLERLSITSQSIHDAFVASDRICEIMSLDTECARMQASAEDRKVVGAIGFENVEFRWGWRPPVLQNISLHIDAGECVGIMGESGSGKSTLMNLLGRFFDPTSGRILIDGMDVRDYTLECLRREIAYVPQQIALFSGSIIDNIRIVRPTATADEIIAAARAARLSLPSDAGIECGLAPSSGEQQRIALARAILQDAPILILDEPAIHLDSEYESAVRSLLDERRGHRTTIVVSNRLLPVDRIIDLDALEGRATARTDTIPWNSRWQEYRFRSDARA